MTPSLLTHIRQTQTWRLESISGKEPLPEHRPEMLYIGCIDARLDPVADIGIPQGKALIFRNIGAMVLPEGGDVPNPEAVSVGAALEFFLSHIPDKNGKVKHIVISGHTHCGGIAHACALDHGGHGGGDRFLPRYLALLEGAIRNVFGKHSADVKDSAKMRAVEHESVRLSVQNLMNYGLVREAVKAGRVQIHGWVIDTATQRIEEMERGANGEFTGRFVLMGEN